MLKVVVGRHIGGITLNPLEYLLDDEGEIKSFDSEEKAREYLLGKGFTDEDIFWLVFEEVEVKENVVQ